MPISMPRFLLTCALLIAVSIGSPLLVLGIAFSGSIAVFVFSFIVMVLLTTSIPLLFKKHSYKLALIEIAPFALLASFMILNGGKGSPDGDSEFNLSWIIILSIYTGTVLTGNYLAKLWSKKYSK